MKKILANNILALLTVTACCPLFAGVGIYWNITNLTNSTGEFTTCPPNIACADDQTIKLLPGDSAKNITHQEAPGSYYDTPFHTQKSIYVNNSKICTIHFWGKTYYSFGPRMKTEGISTINSFNNLYYNCKPAKFIKKSAVQGDTEFIPVSIIPSTLKPLNPPNALPLNPPNMQPLKPGNYIKSSVVRRSYYYDVTCLNGAFSTFYPTKPGTCFDYTNGIQSYPTPQTCYPSFRIPYLEEFNEQIGQHFCKLPPRLQSLKPGDYIESSQVKPEGYDVRYEVKCKNGSSATFRAAHPGNCYGYTDGVHTYHTPQTCYPTFRTPTLEEFNEEVGKPFCILPIELPSPKGR